MTSQSRSILTQFNRFELLRESVVIEDSDEAEAKLDFLFVENANPITGEAGEATVDVSRIISMCGHYAKKSSLGNVHESIRECSPRINPETSAPMRLAADAISQNAGFQVYLALRTIKSNPPLQDPAQGRGGDALRSRDSNPASTVQNKTRSTTSIRQGSSQASTLQESEAEDQQSLHPTAKGREGRSTSPHSSAEEQLSAVESFAAGDQHSQRLRCLTAVSPQKALPPILLGILGHWDIGGDPESVDGAAATRGILVTDEEVETSKGNETKGKKRLRQTIEDWSADQPLRDRAFGGSQPLPIRDFGTQMIQGSSQVAGTQETQVPVISTQPEPGLYGSRPEAKKGKKKQKVAGFK